MNPPMIGGNALIDSYAGYSGIRTGETFRKLLGGSMMQQLYDNLWHYLEKSTRDPLQRSELVTMATLKTSHA